MRKTTSIQISLVVSLLACGCQPAAEPDTPPRSSGEQKIDDAGNAPAHLQPRYPLPSDPLARLLLTTPPAPQSLLAGYAVVEVRPNPPRLEADASTKVSKLTITLNGPFASHKISYSVYSTAEDAKTLFGGIAKPPEERNVVKTKSLTLPGFDTAVWAESTHESYPNQELNLDIVRTSVATPSANVIALTQVIVEGEADPAAESFAVELLRAALEHLRYVRGDEVASKSGGK